MGAEEVYFELPAAGLTLRGRRTGAPDGLPIICLHGWLDNCASFEALFDELAGRNLVAIDLPGHGLSDRLPSATCQLVDYAACVLELAHRQGWDRFHLVGHSLGGMIAMIIAGIHPDKVGRVVLIDPVVHVSADPSRLRDSVSAYLATALADRLPRPHFSNRRQAVRTRARTGGSLLDTAERLCERDLVETGTGYTWSTDIRLRYSFVETLTESQMREFVRAASAPLLVLTAQQSTTPSTFDTSWATGAVRQVSLPGGHHLHIENAEPVAREIHTFLDD